MSSMVEILPLLAPCNLHDTHHEGQSHHDRNLLCHILRPADNHLALLEGYRHVHYDHHESYLVSWSVLGQPGCWLVIGYRAKPQAGLTLRFLPLNRLSFITKACATRFGSVNSTYAYLHHTISGPSLARQRERLRVWGILSCWELVEKEV